MIYHEMSENVKFALQTTLVMSIIICLLVIFLSDRKLYLKPYFYVKPNICKYRELFTSTNEATLIKLSKFVQFLWKSFLCRLFFQMIEINYVSIYMKINHIFFVIKGQFPLIDYISI